MQDWMQAYRLAKFELRASKVSFLVLLLFVIIMGLFFGSSTGSYLEQGYVEFDLFFVVVFTISPMWIKPKDFQSRKVNSDIFASPPVIMLKQLPVKHDVIIKSRFLTYFIYTIPFQVLMLLLLYLLSPELRDLLSLGSYSAFSIIWLSFGIYGGCIVPASEAGDRTTIMAMVVYGLVPIISLIALFTVVYLLFHFGVFYWTIILAQKWPILSSLTSILLAIIGVRYWQHYMKKTMIKLDYH